MAGIRTLLMLAEPNGDCPVTTPQTPATRPVPFRTALVAAAALAALLTGPASARAQVCGDVNEDNKVTATDAQKVLRAAVGQPVELICTDQCAALEARVAALEALLANVTVDGDNLVLTGMNLQVVSGSGTTNGTVNGTGNLIVGYNETNEGNEKRTGSHNLVVGRYHGYSNYGGIVAGEDNVITGKVASVLGGAQNLASGDGSVVVAGEDNWASSATSVVLAGEANRSNARSCSVLSGQSNLCSGILSTVVGGSNNTCTGQGSVLAGGSSRVLNSNVALLLASLGTYF